MKITGVKATCHNVPLSLPYVKEIFWQGAFVCVRVETDEGITGVGFTSRVNRFAVREYILRDLGPFVVGQDPLDTESIWYKVLRKFDHRTMIGVMASAMSALDIALWDVKGKALGQPVYRLLGGYSQRVPVYATFGLFRYSREELVAVAKERVAEGHDKIKMVVSRDGGKNLAEDQARVEVVREAVGDGIQIMVDANQQLDLRKATELARRIEPCNITWFEEPVNHNDVHDMAALRTRTTIPIAAGQTQEMSWHFRHLIAGGAVDIVQPDVVNVGGFTEGLKVAHMAQVYDLSLATHGWPHLNMQLIAGVSNGWRVEFHDGPLKLGEAIFIDPPKPEGGWVTLPDKPGLGLELNEAALKEYEES